MSEEDELSTEVWLEQFSIDGLTGIQVGRNASENTVVVLEGSFPFLAQAMPSLMS